MTDKNIFGEVPLVVHNAVINTLDSLEERPAKSAKSVSVWRYIPRAAVLVFICSLLTGMTISTVASVRELYKQRMEALTKEEYQEFHDMWDENYNRLLTSEEKARYKELEEMYKKNGVFPKSQITVLEEGETYNGKGIAWDSASNTIYFPEEELNDEELLQLIDYNNKRMYSIYKLDEERTNEKIAWRSRMADMTMEEMEELYKIYHYANEEIGGVFCRPLPKEEQARYEELVRKYEEEGLYTENEIPIIRYKKDYTGEGIAFCIQDCIFYFPERKLTDDELLQIIDFEHRAIYAFWKISDEVDFGFRESLPVIIREYELFRQRMEELDKEDFEAFYNMCEKEANRQLAVEELSRYEALEDTYKRKGVFPEAQITVLEEGEAYSGKGIGFDVTSGTIYFPEEELSDEEVLQLIDYRNKYAYSIYMLQVESTKAEIPWIARAEEMDSGEMKFLYQRWKYADIWGESDTEERGGICRELSEEERTRYDELYEKYEEEGLFPENEVSTIREPENYTGEDVAFCRRDCTFYIPERELTDDEMLQIIDYIHRAEYVCNKLNYEVAFGLREEFIIYYD